MTARWRVDHVEHMAQAWDEGYDAAERVRIPNGAHLTETVNPYRVLPPAWCLCGYVDDRGDGTCGNCGLPIMTDDDEATP